ncbi:MFS transporter [Aliirhizobium smilacinae]|uniref:MFS transporter n=1 Tax=Aliirhizobium smilacinae TaxID=1395944 RepID=A0A5C4X855_9HYPH|nr:MFS transporter [Rhizobium smilacinae]TNM59528.1 MFS transporter [Rhizobium smilacinae]
MTATLSKLSARSGAWTVLGLLAGLYAAQSVTGSMVQSALPVALRDAGMPLDQIGYLAVLFLPWALKFLWAPLVDRFFTERGWILACQMGIATCFLTAMAFPPQTHLIPLSIVLVVMASLAATQDIATDSLAVRATSEETRGAASGASTAGAYLGFLLGGGLWLVIYSHAGWAVSMAAMACFILLLTIPVLLSANLAAPREQSAGTRRVALRASFSNRMLKSGLVFLLVYQVGIRMGSSMTGPYLVDKGMSLDAIGMVRGAGGAIAGFIAATLAALLVQAIGVQRGLFVAAALNAMLLLALASLEFVGSVWPPLLATLLVAQVAAVAMSFVALYAAMMNWCNPAQTATDFAILQSLDAIVAIAASAVAGQLGNTLGYGVLFSISAAFVVLAMLLASRLLAFSGPTLTYFSSHEKVSEQ